MKINLKRGFVAGALILVPLLNSMTPAEAQRRGANRGQGGFGAGGSGGFFPLPEGVNRLVAVDALNLIIVESANANTPNDRRYDVIRPLHLPSAGIVRLFGGTVITTEELLFGNSGGNGGNGGGGFGGGFGGSGFGATNIGGGSTTGGGFGGGNTGGVGGDTGGFGGGDTGGFGGGTTTTTGQTLNDVPGLLGSALGGANFNTQEVGAQ